MFELISYEKFRDTKDVRFFDISVNESNYRDLVIHSGPAVSPPNDEEFKNWQFYIHHNQEDNLLAISGGRTFFLVNSEDLLCLLFFKLSSRLILFNKTYSIFGSLTD